MRETRDKGHGVYAREHELLASVERIAETAASPEVIAEQLDILLKAYRKLIRQTEKITRVGDSIQRKLVKAREEIEAKNRTLVSAQKQLVRKEKMTAMNTLVSGIAHELRNPLNFIANLSRMQIQLLEDVSALEHDTPPDAETWAHMREDLTELVEGARIICEHGERACAIVARTHQLSREDPGSPYPIDLNLLLTGYARQVRDMLSDRCPLADLVFREDFDSSLKEIPVAPGDLGFVFTQLITNALEAMQDREDTESGYTPILELITQSLADTVVIRIRDNGPGIEEAERDKLFTPFYTTKPTGRGNIGLGLYISMDIIVNGYGGQIDYQRVDGLSELSISLPIPSEQHPIQSKS